MAIARGAGTEIIRSLTAEDVDNTAQTVIIGAQHHIYTVLSVICYAVALNADTDYIKMWMDGYDNKAGTTAETLNIFQQDMSVAQTYVWNDKFSFNGFEGTDYAGPMNSVADQDLIADQGSSVAQLLNVGAEHASDNFDIFCTFIDQNNA